jgi:hypothetical protein
MRLTLDILKRLNDFEFIEEITGEYTGTLTGMGASHESRRSMKTNGLSCVLMIHNSIKVIINWFVFEYSSSSVCMMLDVAWLPPQMKFRAVYGYLVIA